MTCQDWGKAVMPNIFISPNTGIFSFKVILKSYQDYLPFVGIQSLYKSKLVSLMKLLSGFHDNSRIVVDTQNNEIRSIFGEVEELVTVNYLFDSLEDDIFEMGQSNRELQIT